MDEVQDNLLIDTLRMHQISVFAVTLLTVAVLRMICINQNGLFWAGDTAQVRVIVSRRTRLTILQTISIGSSFRFADLKAYQYRVEVEYLLIPRAARANGLIRNGFHMSRVSPQSNRRRLNLLQTTVLIVVS